MRVRSAWLAAVFVVLHGCAGLAWAAEAPAATYALNISPAWKVGQKYGFTYDLILAQKIISAVTAGSGQSSNQQQTINLHFEADGEVLAVFPNGSIQQAALTVKALRIAPANSPARDLLQAGTRIVAEKNQDEQKTYRINDKLVPAEVARVLLQLIDLGEPQYTEQVVFGPPGPVAVGASWPVNAAAVLAQQRKFPGATKVTGEMKLDKISGEGADLVAKLTGTFSVDGGKAPPPFETKGAEYTVTLVGTYPASAKGTQTVNMIETMRYTGESVGPAGTLTVNSEVVGTRRQEIEFR